MVAPAHLVSAAENLIPKIVLQETEESWESIFKGLTALRNLCQDWAFDHSQELIHIIRSVVRPIASSMTSERTRLSGAAIDLVSTVAAVLGTSFEPLLHFFLPVLLSLCGRTNKVITNRASVCIGNIVESTQLPSILPYFARHIKDKSMSIRLTAAEGALSCIKCFNPPELEKDARVKDIEMIIRVTVRDSHAEVRAVSKKIYEAFQILLPDRVQDFIAPLSPTMRKYLYIKASNPSEQFPLHQMASGAGRKGRGALSVVGGLRKGRRPTANQNEHNQAVESSLKSKRSQIAPTTALDQYLAEPTRSTTAAQVPLRPNLQPREADLTQPPRVVDLPMKDRSTTCARRLNITAPHAPRNAPSCAIPSSSGPALHSQRLTKAASGEVPRKPQSGPRRIPMIDSQLGQLSAKTNNIDISNASTNCAVSQGQARPTVRRSRTGKITETLSASVSNPLSERVKLEGVTRPTFSSRSRTQSIVQRKALDAGTSSNRVYVSRQTVKDRVRCHGQVQPEVTAQLQPNSIPLPPSPPRAMLNSQTCIPETPAISPDLHSEMTSPRQRTPSDSFILLDQYVPPTPGIDENAVAVTNQFDSMGGYIEDKELQMSFSTPCASTTLLGRPDSPAKTPISSLLSSIQRGFLFTPH